ncbi:MAG: sulfotransferase, partial [Acidimicrobiales bacterium]
MTDTVRLDDLAEPRLTDRQREMQRLAAEYPVTLTVEAILAAARSRTGLDDFGAEDFLGRLAVLVASAEEDITLLPSGRHGVHADLVRYAANRLLIHDTLERHPEILDVEITAPVIVAGLPRSGTTHLLNLLAADTRFRSLPYWESCEPVSTPDEAPIVAGEDPRYTRRRQEWAATDELLPLLKAMHAMTPDHIHEELELMGPDFASYNFEWRWYAPRWRDHYLAHDQAPHYAYMKRVLKLLQWQDEQADRERKARWVLKCPQHLEQLPVLDATFPDATIVITHRDPVSVIASASTMTAYGDRMRRSPVDPPRTGRYWVDRIETLLRSCVRDRDLIGPARVLDVRFDDFMADDLATVQAVYETAGIEMNPDAERALRRYIEDNPRGQHGRLGYDLEGDFGLDPSAERARFDFYFDRFD